MNDTGMERRATRKDDRAEETSDATMLRNYRAPEVVGYYAREGEIFPGERDIYDRYVRSGWKILDLGVGAGRTTSYLSDRAERYVGIDFSPEMVEYCTKKFRHLEFYVADASDLSAFSDSSFDCVVFSYNGIDCLYPHERRSACISECARVLASGGMFIFSSHNARSLIIGVDEQAIKARAEKIVAAIASPPSVWFRMLRRSVLALGTPYVTLKYSVAFAKRRISSGGFWKGRGYFEEQSEVGLDMLTLYGATPSKIVKDLEKFGFRLLAKTPESPHIHCRLFPVWFNYAFQLIGRRSVGCSLRES